MNGGLSITAFQGRRTGGTDVPVTRWYGLWPESTASTIVRRAAAVNTESALMKTSTISRFLAVEEWIS